MLAVIPVLIPSFKPSARFLLNDGERRHIQDDDRRSSTGSAPAEFEFNAAFNMLRLAQCIVASGKCDGEAVSPFCMDAMYRSGIFYARQHSQTEDQSSLEALHDIEKCFRFLSGRWRSAGKAFRSPVLLTHELTACRALSLNDECQSYLWYTLTEPSTHTNSNPWRGREANVQYSWLIRKHSGAWGLSISAMRRAFQEAQVSRLLA
jgi:hypothetical protein